jgi:uncharacterized surface protein with fasciclin (FAS1) repeats
VLPPGYSAGPRPAATSPDARPALLEVYEFGSVSSTQVSQTISGLAASNPNLSTLATALRVAGLDATLASGGPFTVFAPTDEAFAKLPAGTVAALNAATAATTGCGISALTVVGGTAAVSAGVFDALKAWADGKGTVPAPTRLAGDDRIGTALAVAAKAVTKSAVVLATADNFPDALTAGVAMTIDPVNGDKSTIVIDASWGLGELVVSGTVTPDNLRVDKVMRTVSEEIIGDKHIELVPDVSSRSVIEREVEPERRTVRCLSDVDVAAIAAIAKRAEKHFGCPQDIEWAIDRGLPEGENLLLLQSRPETVWSTRTIEPSTATSGFGIESITRSLLTQIGR